MTDILTNEVVEKIRLKLHYDLHSHLQNCNHSDTYEVIASGIENGLIKGHLGEKWFDLIIRKGKTNHFGIRVFETFLWDLEIGQYSPNTGGIPLDASEILNILDLILIDYR